MEQEEFEEFKAEVHPLTSQMQEVLEDKGEVAEVDFQVVDQPCVLVTCVEHGWPGSSGISTRKTVKVNLKHSIMTGLKKAAAGEPDEIITDTIWLLFDAVLLTPGFNVDEPAQFTNRAHRMIEHVLKKRPTNKRTS